MIASSFYIQILREIQQQVFSIFFPIPNNEECHPAKGKQTCSCYEAQLKFVSFFYSAAKNVTIYGI
jgi:hypothetical protein